MMPDETRTEWQKFLSAVKNMRRAQKEYFRTRSWNKLSESKELEKSVDEMVKRIDADVRTEDPQLALWG